MKYDIPTLLAFRQDACVDIGNFSVHAIDNNLLNGGKNNISVLKERSVNSCRIVPGVTVDSNEEVTAASDGKSKYPSRQPNGPPDSIITQIDSGFARFLEEYTSPKHHRVTAGGHVVPMNSETPVPQFKLPEGTLEGEGLSGGAGHDGKTQSKIRTAVGVAREQCLSDDSVATSASSGFPSMTPNVPHATAQAIEMDEYMIQNQLPDLKQYIHPPVPILTTPFLQPFMPNNYQPGPVPQDYLPLFQNYPAYYGSTGNATWYLNTSQPLAAQGQSLTGSTPNFGTTAGNVCTIFSSTANTELPNTLSLCPSTVINGTQEGDASFVAVSQSLPITGGLYGWSLLDVTKEFESLSVKLASLDRYLAIHFNLDSNSKKNLVTQRMELVRELDLKRQLKEQLEAGLGNWQQELRVLGAQVATAPSLQPGPLQPCSEDLKNGLNVPSWTPAATINNTPFIWPYPISIAQGLMPLANEAPSECMPHQFPALGSIIGFPSSLSYEEIQPSISIPYGNQKTDPVRDESNTQVIHGHQRTYNYSLNGHTDNGGWSIPAQSAPLEISQIHRKVEETAKRSEPLDELLKGLTIATTNISKFDRRLRSPCQTDSDHVTSDSMDKRSCAFSEGKELSTNRTNFVPTDEDGDGKSYYSSSLSTTQELNKQCTTMSQQVVGATCEQSKGKDHWRTVLVVKLFAVDIITITDALSRNRENEITEGANSRDAINGKRLSDVDNVARDSNNATAERYEQQLLVVDSLTDHAATKDTFGQIRRNIPMAFTSWKRKEDQISSHNACAPVVSQVNAHGFLPPFDGAGDIPDSAISELDALLDSGHGDSYSDKTNGSPSEMKDHPWYLKAPRERPSPMEVRKFFQKVEEKEREMIHKYRTENSS